MTKLAIQNYIIPDFFGKKLKVYGEHGILPSTELVFKDKRFKNKCRVMKFRNLSKTQKEVLLRLARGRVKYSFLGILINCE